MPTGRVKWYDAAKGFGFVTSDEGGDVFLSKAALPAGVAELKTGQRVEFGLVDSRKGAQAMGVKLIDAPPSLAELRRRPADQLHSMIEDMIKVLEQQVQLVGRAPPQLGQGRRGIDQLDAHGLGPLAAVDHPELHPLTGLEFGHASRQRALGQEHVTALIAGDEPESLRRVVPLHSTRGHR